MKDAASDLTVRLTAAMDRIAALEALLREACELAISFDVHGPQPGERERIAAIKKEAGGDE